MKNTQTQAGQGLSGFIIGLLLATIVIAGVLFFLNKNKTPFKQPEIQTQTPSAPEILTPNGQQTSTEPAMASSDLINDPIDIQAEDDNLAASTPVVPTAPVVTDKPAISKPQPKPAQPTAEKPTQVSPEQILNSGSIEKAQAATRQEAQKSKANPTEQKNQVLLQLGSFKDNTAADAQRAKLAILGVDTRVVKSSVNGQTVYRVQTGHLSRQQANQMADRLRQNQIDSLMRTAP